jgi:probable HAF family extracellular repeat protein
MLKCTLLIPLNGLLAAAGLLPLTAFAQSHSAQVACACWITGLSADGRAATGQFLDNYETLRWKADKGAKRLGRSTLETLGTSSGMPAMSSDGKKIAATILDDTGTVGTQGLWTQGRGWLQLAPPLPADGGKMDNENSSVYGMSRDGKVVTGLYWRPNQTGGSAHGSVWTAATNMVGMDTDGGSSRIDDANEDGSVMVGWEENATQGNRRATVWENGQKTILDNGDWSTEASAVNRKGNVIVGMTANARKGVLVASMWQRHGQQWKRQGLGSLKGIDWSGLTYPNGVSDDGQVVVGYASRYWGDAHGFVWTAAGGFQDAAKYLAGFGYRDRDYDIVGVTAVSADGQTLAVQEQRSSSPWDTRAVIVTTVAATSP